MKRILVAFKRSAVIDWKVCVTCLLWVWMVQEVTLQRALALGRTQGAKVELGTSRPVTVADTIRMTKPGSPDSYAGDSASGNIANFSSDGKKCVVVLRKGNLENDTNEYSLLLWNTDQLYDSLGPRSLLRMSSNSNREAIAAVTWLQDNETIAFLGEHPGEHRQLYTFDMRTRRLNQLTHCATNVLSYSMTPKGEEIAYVTEEPVEALVDDKVRREGVVVRTQRLRDLILEQKGGRFDSNIGSNHIYMLRGGMTTSLGITYGWPGNQPFLSPDGKFVVILNQVLQSPDNWNEYSDTFLHEWTNVKFEPGQYSPIHRYELIDTLTGIARVLLNSPSRGSDVVWSPDSRSVLIVNTYLPLDNTEGAERLARQDNRFMVDVKVPSGEFTTIAEGDLRVLDWDSNANRVTVEDRRQNGKGGVHTTLFFQRRTGIWQSVGPAAAAVPIRPEVVVEEDMNTPPQIVAIDPGTRKKHLVLDLNPQFRDLRFARVEEVQWKNSEGRAVKGGLYYPIDYAPGKRYPLVVQTHGWNPTKFWIDGPWTTAFAAQPMAGKGIMVLQVEENETEDFDTPREFPREVSTLEHAIDCLDSKGLIDRNRVGIIGFSRSGDIVSYALTHSKFHFAAAAVADGSDQGYFNYLVNINTGERELEFINGGLPFSDGLKSWITSSSEFNLDKVHTPVRLLALGPDILLEAEWGWFAGSLRLGKPIEMVYLPDAVHVLQKPWERRVSQEGDVDWFVFWLKGEEDPDPSKREQYARWRELRAQEHDSVEK